MATKAAVKAAPEKGAPSRKKDSAKLYGRFALDFAAVASQMEDRIKDPDAKPLRTRIAEAKEHRAAPKAAAESFALAPAADTGATEAALLRLKALDERALAETGPMAPVDASRANWTPMGPLAIPNGQTYGGARVLISGRVTAIAPHPTNANTILIGTSRGGVWRTLDGGNTWTALTDNEQSLAIGALAIGIDNPDVLYAGTGEGNVQFYSTTYAESSAPGVYLGAGILRSADGGNTWTPQATNLLAGHSFYRIVVDRNDSNHAFAATSKGLCRTTNGSAWTALSGGGLPNINATVIACTDVMVDRGDATGNTVYAAFFRDGVYKSTNALAANPTFTKQTTGLPAGNTTSRISLAQSASNPARKYALVGSYGPPDAFLGLYRTTNAAGTTWELCTSDSTIDLYGTFTSDVNVDPTTQDLVYISGVELYKCQRNAGTGAWTVTNIGGNIHADSHAFAFHPTLNQTIYSGNDGGFYISRNAGGTWEDAPNEGLCLLQYEAIDYHPKSDALVQCGTQDNGTQQYRNSPVHYHSADGDGGYCTISKTNPNDVTHSYYGDTPRRSTAGGKFGTYSGVSTGLNGYGLFYPPAAISPSSERMVWATEVVNIDDAMGTGGWPGSGVGQAQISGEISAISFASDNIVYCATTHGHVCRLDRSGTTWTARALHTATLPDGWIWDVQNVPGDPNTILVVYSGFGLAQHVWRGAVPATGAATWTAVSSGLPDVPMYALALESATQWFVGTDIGVYRSTDAGATWSNFSQGLPNTAVYDLRLREGSHLLRAATHGRGLWEVRTDLAVQPTVDLFVRDNIMDTGRAPTPQPITAAWEDPTRHIALNDPCYWWECADLKTDAPPTWQLTPAEVNYLNFETKLIHEDPEKGNTNRFYVQVHNRGPLPANNVTVKIMLAPTSAGLPDLPANFWTAWPNCTGDAHWTAIGNPQTIPSLEPLRPAVLEWDWAPLATQDTNSCLLVVLDSPSDPIPASTKAVFNIAQLVVNEKRIGLRNLHLVNLLPDTLVPIHFNLFASPAWEGVHHLRIPLPDPHILMGMLLSQRTSKRIAAKLPAGMKMAKLSAKDLDLIKQYWLKHELRSDASWEELVKTYDTTRVYSVDARSKGADLPLSIKGDQQDEMMLLFRPGEQPIRPAQVLGKLTLIQTVGKAIAGGSTFVFRLARR